MRILATAYPLADVARVVGGDQVRVQWLVERGGLLRDVPFTPELKQRLSGAELIISDGRSEPWSVQDSGGVNALPRALRLDQLDTDRSGTAGFSWLDPVVTQAAITDLARRLGARRPEQREQFDANARSFNEQIAALLARYRATFNAKRYRVLTLVDDFTPLLRRMGIDEKHVDTSVPGRFDNSDWRNVDDAVKGNERIDAIVVGADTSTLVRAEIERRTGLPVIALDSLGTSAENDRNTYLKLMQYNFEQLSRLTSGTTTKP